MKRSEINKALKELEAMCAQEHCYLPPFCNFTPEEWKSKGHEYDEVRDCMLGWDITDYGLGDFDKMCIRDRYSHVSHLTALLQIVQPQFYWGNRNRLQFHFLPSLHTHEYQPHMSDAYRHIPRQIYH